MSSNEAAATESPTRPTIRDAVMSPKNTSIIPPYLWESSSFHIKTTESGNIAATAVDSTVSTVTINIDSTKLPSVRPCMSHERPFNRITGVICQAIRDLSGLGIEAAPVRSGLTLRLGNRGISIDSGLFFTYRGVPVAGYNPHQARCINTRIPYYQTGQGIAGSADGVNWAIIIAIAQPQRKAIVSKDMVPNYPLNVMTFSVSEDVTELHVYTAKVEEYYLKALKTPKCQWRMNCRSLTPRAIQLSKTLSMC